MKRCAIILGLISGLFAPATVTAQDQVDEPQWIFRERHGNGTPSPTAIFLSWNYAGVIFRATCQADKSGNDGWPGNGGITLHSYPEPYILAQDENGEYLPAVFPPYKITRGGKNMVVDTKVEGQSVRGDFAVTAQLLEILEPGKNTLEIYVKSEMDEPIYAGQAEPLFRLAKLCQKKP